jgi:hypothetical protein
LWARLFHISDEVQSDPHDGVVEICRQGLALAPAAELAVFRAIDPDGVRRLASGYRSLASVFRGPIYLPRLCRSEIGNG